MSATDPAGAGAPRTIEAVVTDVERSRAGDRTRPWPVHGRRVGQFDDADYRRACEQHVNIQQFCVRRHLMARNDGDFVAAAFLAIAGHAPEVSIWHHHTQRLASGEGSRDDLLDELQQSEAGRDRNVMIFDGRQLRRFVEVAEIGLQDVLRLLLGLARRQIRRRASTAWSRVRAMVR